MRGFSFGLGFGIFLNLYKPYINYTWTMLPNGQVQNNGNSGTNLQLYSGNPLDFQGSQHINIGTYPALNNTLTISTGFKSTAGDFGYLLRTNLDGFIKINADGIIDTYVGGVEIDNIGITVPDEYTNLTLTINNGNLKSYINGNLYSDISVGQLNNNCLNNVSIGALTNGSSFFDGQLDYLTISDRVLTAEEIALSNSNPNAFYDSMVNDANTLFATDFRGTAGYIADDKNKVVGSELVIDNWTVNDASITAVNNSITFTNTLGGKDARQTFTLEVGKQYMYSMDIKSISGTLTLVGIKDITTTGAFQYVFTASNTSITPIIRAGNTLNCVIEDIGFKEISAVYPITNYSETMRTNFQQETTGLQDLTRSFDSLGFYTGVTDYLNGNGVGYGDTGWVPDLNTSITIEFIVYTPDDTISRNTGFYSGIATNTDNFRVTYRKDFISGIFGNGSSGSKWTAMNGYRYVTVVLDGSHYSMYKDSLLLADSVPYSYSTSFESQTWLLGAMWNHNKTSLEGFIDAPIKLFKVHNKVLTQEEITSNYNDYVARGLLNG